jgi:hypothetical protein
VRTGSRPAYQAERRLRAGGADADGERSRMVEVPSVGGRQPGCSAARYFVRFFSRAEEILVAAEEISGPADKQILSSVVLIGGGR